MNQQNTRVAMRPPLLGGIASETIKLRTLPINTVLAVISLLIIVTPGALLSVSLLTRLTDPRFEGQQIDAAPLQFVDSVLWAQLVIAVLAVLAVTNEYASGQTKLSLLALPTRWPWLAGKCIVIASVAFLIGVIGAATSLGVSALILSGSDVHYDLRMSETVILAFRSGLYLAAIAVLAVGIATVSRHVVTGLIATLLLLVVAPPLLSSIPVIREAADFTPTYAGRRLISDFASITELAPWVGFAVLVAWALIAVFGAGILLKVRDA